MLLDGGLGTIRALLPGAGEFAVAHYTAMGTVPKVVRTGGWRSVWSTSVRFLNDREEFVLGARAFSSQAASMRLRPETEAALAKLDPMDASVGIDVYATSFSAEPDDLGQWRGYADDGFGVSLVTTAASLDVLCASGEGEIAAPVLYEPSEHTRFAGELLTGLDASSLDVQERFLTLQVAATFLKDAGFRSEREFRYVRIVDTNAPEIRMRESRKRLIPYLDSLDSGGQVLDLRRVIVGPGWQLRTLSDDVRKTHPVILGLKRHFDLQGLGK